MTSTTQNIKKHMSKAVVLSKMVDKLPPNEALAALTLALALQLCLVDIKEGSTRKQLVDAFAMLLQNAVAELDAAVEEALNGHE